MQQTITREHRGAFVLMVDLSSSMLEPLDTTQLSSVDIDIEHSIISKGEYVVKCVNNILMELYYRAFKDGEVVNYYDIAVITYSGDGVNVVSSTDGSKHFTPVNELYSDNECYFSLKFKGSDDDDHTGAIHCLLGGLTPMYQAYSECFDMVHSWCSDPKNRYSISPIIINISDAMFTDSDATDMKKIISSLSSLRTSIASVITLNITISAKSGGNNLIFPTDQELESFSDENIAKLASISTIMPPPFIPMIESVRRRAGYNVEAGEQAQYRAIGYNIDMSDLMSVIQIGTNSMLIK